MINENKEILCTLGIPRSKDKDQGSDSPLGELAEGLYLSILSSYMTVMFVKVKYITIIFVFSTLIFTLLQ